MTLVKTCMWMLGSQKVDCSGIYYFPFFFFNLLNLFG